MHDTQISSPTDQHRPAAEPAWLLQELGMHCCSMPICCRPQHGLLDHDMLQAAQMLHASPCQL